MTRKENQHWGYDKGHGDLILLNIRAELDGIKARHDVHGKSDCERVMDKIHGT